MVTTGKGYFAMIKVSITIINIYAPNNRAPKNMKQKLSELKGEIGKTIIGDFNILLSIIDSITKQKINKEKMT
jgi:hypothetical protein